MFGEKYTEGHSNPRLFAVRFQEGKTIQETGFILFKLTNPEGQVVNKVFHRNDNGDAHVAKLVSIRLTLECNLPNEERCRIRQKLADHLSRDDSTKTIQQLVAYIEEYLSADGSLHKTCTKRNCVKSEQASSSTALFSYLAHFNGWNVDSFDKHDALRIVQEEQLVQNNSDVALTASHNQLCDLCFDPCSHMNSSAMLSCGHWFCNNCWSYDLVSRVMRGDQQMLCPGYKCNTIIDMVTLLSLLPYSYYIKYKYFSSNAKLECSSIWKWCQGNEGGCRKIIRATVTNTDAGGSTDGKLEKRICVSCPCKTNWCFDCGKEPHWPTTCKQADLYIEYIRKIGDPKTKKTVSLPSLAPPVTYYVKNVKRCPNCNNPHEKGFGCLILQCAYCGCNFCWNCLEVASTSHHTFAFNTGALILHRDGKKTHHGLNICKEHIAKDYKLVDTELFRNQKSKEAFKCATDWRKHRHQLLKQHPNLPVFLHDWLFLLEWSYALLCISHTKKMKSPLETINS